MNFALENISFHLIDHILFFFLAILLPILGFISSKGMDDYKFEKADKINIYYSNGFFLFITTGIVLTVWNYYERSFIDFGFLSPKWNSTVLMLTLFFVILYLLELFSKKLFQQQQKKMEWAKNLQFLPDDISEFKHYLFLVLAAGICEEVLYRGFLIHYIFSLFGGGSLGIWLAIILPAMFFSIGHIYQGSWAVAKISIGAMILSGIYLLSESLYVVIVLHIAVDIVSAIFAKLILDQQSLTEDVSTEE